MDDQGCVLCEKENASTELDYPIFAERGCTTLKIPICASCLTGRKKRDNQFMLLWLLGTVLAISLCILLTVLNTNTWLLSIPFLLFLGSYFLAFVLPKNLERKKVFKWLERHDYETWHRITFYDVIEN
jgi:predicted nucleic acid-binding Zn ribbon protein